MNVLKGKGKSKEKINTFVFPLLLKKNPYFILKLNDNLTVNLEEII